MSRLIDRTINPVEDAKANNNDGMKNKANLRLVTTLVSDGKSNEKAKKAFGVKLDAIKLNLTQNNSHDGSLKRCIIHMPKFQTPNDHESMANEILAFLLGRRLKKTRNPSIIFIKKTKSSIILNGLIS